MLTFRDLVSGLRKLEVDPTRPVIAHASLSSFGRIKGGAETLLGALLTIFPSLLMPTFTYKTMLTPEAGPDGNGMIYGSGKDLNRMAEFFTARMPADRLMGVLPEMLRQHPRAQRSSHPILSFAGVDLAPAIGLQTLQEPLAPVRYLVEQQGWVLLLGVNHTVNTSIHYAERLAGRKQFVRWALTARGVQECPCFPGCSDGFETLAPSLQNVTRRIRLGQALVQAVPLQELVRAVQSTLAADPLALLCNRSFCERCDEVRQSIHAALGQDAATQA